MNQEELGGGCQKKQARDTWNKHGHRARLWSVLTEEGSRRGKKDQDRTKVMEPS